MYKITQHHQHSDTHVCLGFDVKDPSEHALYRSLPLPGPLGYRMEATALILQALCLVRSCTGNIM